MTVNRIGCPDEIECPECGQMIYGSEDSEGIVYRCDNFSCMAIFDGAELFPPSVHEAPPLPSDPDPLSPARVEAMAREICRLMGLDPDARITTWDFEKDAEATVPKWFHIRDQAVDFIELRLAYERTKP